MMRILDRLLFEFRKYYNFKGLPWLVDDNCEIRHSFIYAVQARIQPDSGFEFLHLEMENPQSTIFGGFPGKLLPYLVGGIGLEPTAFSV